MEAEGGLALAADLGRRSVRTLLVERNENRIGSAKMLEVGVRTMEFCRQLGIASRVRHWGFPFDWALDSAFVTSMSDYELGRVRVPALGAYAMTAITAVTVQDTTGVHSFHVVPPQTVGDQIRVVLDDIGAVHTAHTHLGFQADPVGHGRNGKRLHVLGYYVVATE